MEIMDALPQHQYILVGNVIRDLAARSLILCEKCGLTYRVRLAEDPPKAPCADRSVK